MSKMVSSTIDGLIIYAKAISDSKKPTIIYIHNMSRPIFIAWYL